MSIYPLKLNGFALIKRKIVTILHCNTPQAKTDYFNYKSKFNWIWSFVHRNVDNYTQKHRHKLKKHRRCKNISNRKCWFLIGNFIRCKNVTNNLILFTKQLSNKWICNEWKRAHRSNRIDVDRSFYLFI